MSSGGKKRRKPTPRPRLLPQLHRPFDHQQRKEHRQLISRSSAETAFAGMHYCSQRMFSESIDCMSRNPSRRFASLVPRLTSADGPRND